MKFFNFFKKKPPSPTLKREIALITFDFDFTEYILKDFTEQVDEHDLGTGWDWICLLFDDLINNDEYFEISVYKYNDKNGSYIAVADLIKEYYRYTFDNTYMFVKIKKEYKFLKTILEKGYNHYCMGRVSTNQGNDVFDTPIEFKTPLSINDDQCILVVLHDANSLFILNNPYT